jgi:uncharacterized protein YqeY
LSVIEQVRADATGAMKAGDRELVGALRMLLSELQKDAKEGRGDAVAVLRRERKRRLEAASQFRDGGRDDLAEKEEREAGIIDGYLPAELDDARLSELVGEAIAEVGASGPGDLGQVMKLVMSRSGGQLDGKRASAAVREALSVGA